MKIKPAFTGGLNPGDLGRTVEHNIDSFVLTGKKAAPDGVGKEGDSLVNKIKKILVDENNTENNAEKKNDNVVFDKEEMMKLRDKVRKSDPSEALKNFKRKDQNNN